MIDDKKGTAWLINQIAAGALFGAIAAGGLCVLFDYLAENTKRMEAEKKEALKREIVSEIQNKVDLSNCSVWQLNNKDQTKIEIICDQQQKQ